MAGRVYNRPMQASPLHLAAHSERWHRYCLPPLPPPFPPTMLRSDWIPRLSGLLTPKAAGTVDGDGDGEAMWRCWRGPQVCHQLAELVTSAPPPSAARHHDIAAWAATQPLYAF